MAKEKALGVADVAKALEVEPATARVILRKLDWPKEGNAYAFSKSDIVDIKRKHGEGLGEAKKPAKKAAKKAPAKKAVAKKSAAKKSTRKATEAAGADA